MYVHTYCVTQVCGPASNCRSLQSRSFWVCIGPVPAQPKRRQSNFPGFSSSDSVGTGPESVCRVEPYTYVRTTP